MGLDMYLNKKYYVKNWGHTEKENRYQITIRRGNKFTSIPTSKITYITTEVMYWRKSNAIHQWFVNNVQDGNDDCGHYYVEHEKLQKLLSLVTQVLNDHSKASEILPTQSGFFFGGTDYDEWYFKDLEKTKKELELQLAKDDDGEFEYHSSW